MRHHSTALNNQPNIVLFSQLNCTIDIENIRKEVESLVGSGGSFWIDHVNNKDYLGTWDVLPLRCQYQHRHAHPVLQGFSIAAGDHWENLPAMNLCPAIECLLNQLNCPVKSVRLMRLCAGAEIKPHRDNGLALEFGEARLHLPIHFNDAVSFLVNNVVVPMRAGELWYFNADQVHEVYNRGNEDRISLVIDCIVNEWLIEKVGAGVK